MKEKIIYGFVFFTAFVTVTLLMIYATSAYRNIFEFDFTPVDNTIIQNSQLKFRENQNKIAGFKTNLVDTIKPLTQNNYDTFSMHLKDSILIDSLKILLEEIKRLKTEKEQITINQIQSVKISNNAKQDSIYKTWIKSTVKIYEAMDSKKAAKIIQNYSDNIARDIIFSMKKKKAAEIISELKPEVANRIINLQ